MFDFQPKASLLIIIFVSFVLLSGIDIALDLSEGTDFTHVAQEGVILTLSLLALAWLLLDLRRHALEIRKLRHELSSQKQTLPRPEPYMTDARNRLSHVIARQFDDWQLTASEKEVGWLLLKGLSLKEIAALRDTREKTVRQQASSVYKKADLPGRHAFAAWFIEDAL